VRSMHIVGSQIGNFPDPPLYTTQGGDFGGLTRRSQEPRGVHLQGINCSNSFMGFGVASATIHFPSQGADSGGTTYPRTQGELRSTSGFTSPPEGGGSGCAMSSLCLALYIIMFIELCFNFTYLSLICSIIFSLSRLYLELCSLVVDESA
jgi:hypothetical protein